MLLYASGSGSQRLNTGIVVHGGNTSTTDRVTKTVGQVIGTVAHYALIGASQGSGMYLPSGIVGGTLAQDDRDDAIIYMSQKRDIAGVASNKLMFPVAGPNKMPATTLSGSVVIYPDGWNWSTGAPITAPVVGGETWGASDVDASGRGYWHELQGNLRPVSGLYPAR